MTIVIEKREATNDTSEGLSILKENNSSPTRPRIHSCTLVVWKERIGQLQPRFGSSTTFWD